MGGPSTGSPGRGAGGPGRTVPRGRAPRRCDDPPGTGRPRLAVVFVVGGVAALGLLAGLAGPLGAQTAPTPHTLRLEPDQPSPPARIEAFAFLEGQWRGEGLGGEVDELWSRPMAGTMLGAFRLVREGEPVFYELFALEEAEGTVVLRLKHFDPGPGLPGWEERTEETAFRLVRVGDDVAWFNGLTYRRTPSGELLIHLALRGSDQVLREEVFRFTRVAP